MLNGEIIEQSKTSKKNMLYAIPVYALTLGKSSKWTKVMQDTKLIRWSIQYIINIKCEKCGKKKQVFDVECWTPRYLMTKLVCVENRIVCLLK